MTFIFGAGDRALDLYHVGLTVADLDAAMAQYADAFGFSWRNVHESTMNVLVDGQPRRAEIAVTYSVQGPPYLELVEERRGSVWGASGYGLNQVGFWAEDVRAAMSRLDASGLVAEVSADGSEGRPVRYSYHRLAGGLWLELVHTSFADDLTAWS
jgi:catechol 2,3-dioxygenase-like lactoylglutathione lyase family enzyme